MLVRTFPTPAAIAVSKRHSKDTAFFFIDELLGNPRTVLIPTPKSVKVNVDSSPKELMKKRFWILGIKSSGAEEQGCQTSRVTCFSDFLKEF